MCNCRTTDLNQFGAPGFKKKNNISQSICTLPSSPSKFYKPMLRKVFSPYLALIHEGHHAPEGGGRDGREEGRITGKAGQGWMKGGTCVLPSLLVTVQQRLKRTSRNYPSTYKDIKTIKKVCQGQRLVASSPWAVGFLSTCSASTVNLPCQDNEDNPRSHVFLWSTVRNEIL